MDFTIDLSFWFHLEQLNSETELKRSIIIIIIILTSFLTSFPLNSKKNFKYKFWGRENLIKN